MQCQHERNPQREGGVTGFVAEQAHTEKAAQTAAQQGGDKQHPFRDAPLFFSGFLLVDTHKQEGGRIDYNEVNEQWLHIISFLEGFDLKKCWIIVVLALLLSGCSAVETFETLGNVQHQSPGNPELRQVLLALPEEAAAPVAQSDGNTIYICDAYTIMLQTFASGDMTATVQALSGFAPSQVTMLESRCGDHARYDWVWTAAGEGGDVICRGAVLDDGSYHYSLCVMAQASEAGSLSEEWNGLFGSFCLE